MARPEAALEHYESQARQAQATVLLVQRQWRRMSFDDLERSWAKIVRLLTVTVASGMLGAAKAGAAYVPEALDDDTAAGLVAAASFARTASDGRPLDTLLYAAVIRVKERLNQGVEPPLALDAGGEWLNTLARTQVADAARGAAGATIAATPRAGYVRLVSPPCCQRCAVLSGKFFRWNTGFQRHPRCDCRHLPAHEGTRTADLTDRIGPDQVRDLTVAQRQAVSDGADLNQVINAHRPNSRSKNRLYTSEGTTSRGVYGGYERRPDGSLRRRGKGEKQPRRLTPEAIYRLTSSREEAVRLLGRYGYLVDDEVLAVRRLRALL